MNKQRTSFDFGFDDYSDSFTSFNLHREHAVAQIKTDEVYKKLLINSVKRIHNIKDKQQLIDKITSDYRDAFNEIYDIIKINEYYYFKTEIEQIGFGFDLPEDDFCYENIYNNFYILSKIKKYNCDTYKKINKLSLNILQNKKNK